MNVETARDILAQLYPGRTISVDQTAWNHVTRKNTKIMINVWKLEPEPSPGGTDIICSCEGTDVKEVCIAAIAAMAKYEAKVAVEAKRIEETEDGATES